MFAAAEQPPPGQTSESEARLATHNLYVDLDILSSLLKFYHVSLSLYQVIKP
jgi:hypothetical protein